MKTMKSLIVVTLLVAGTTLMAQTNRSNNYADRAFKQTSQLVNTLNLTDEQTVEILAINQKYTDMDTYRSTNSQLLGKERRKVRKNTLTAQAKEIKSILKGYQKEKFEYMVANHEVLAPTIRPMVASRINVPGRRNLSANTQTIRPSLQVANSHVQRMPFRTGVPSFGFR